MELSLIPDSAPFNAEQRAWLNGFLAGWLGLQGTPAKDGMIPPLPLPAAPTPLETAKAEASEPWHDPALALDERLALAEDRPHEQRLMAAMAQLDCGTCGYLCRTYAKAIADGSESSLTLCSPGGTETVKALKRLVKETKAGTPGVVQSHAKPLSGTSEPVEETYSRKRPFTAKVLRSLRLTGMDSEKEVRHVEIDLKAGPSYEVGDSLGLFPENCPDLVDELIAELGWEPSQSVDLPDARNLSLREELIGSRDLTEITDELLELLAQSSDDPIEAKRLTEFLEDGAAIADFDVLDLLREFPRARPRAGDFVASLAKLKPRLYSISSSPNRHTGQVHLTVRRVAYAIRSRVRKGVASTHLSDRVVPGSKLRVFVQKSHGFALPKDLSANIIMIGPGTGIAPFRAFLHEREATHAQGKNWLFFGDQRQECDYLYREELAEFVCRGTLTYLDTAFSRDQEEKVYVQHRLLERGAELYQWIANGAFIYVCGDAKRMAADVDRALRTILESHGGMSKDSAVAYLAELARSRRYARDVY